MSLEKGAKMPGKYLERSDGSPPKVTTAGIKRLDELVTDSTGDVYAITDGLSPVMAAAAMARLSRNPNDMRVVILDEFADQKGKDAALLHRVISQYGDDSVQQLVGVQLVVENASNILTKVLEWGRLAAYLEQSTRYIFFDQKDSEENYRFFVPSGLGELESEYVSTLNAIFDTYSEMVRGITEFVRKKHPQGDEQHGPWLAATRAQACDAVRPVLPSATKSTVGIFGSTQAVDNLIMNLLSHPLEEARATGQKILHEVRKVVPEFFERTDIPERGGGTVAYKAGTKEAVRALVTELGFGATLQPQLNESVLLASYWPENDWDLTGDLIFEATDLSGEELDRRVAELDDEEIDRLFQTYIGERLNRRHRPGRAFEIPHYKWEILADYGTFRDIQRHRMVDGMEWQLLTPDYGYDIPELVVEAGFQREFVRCFGLSMVLCDAMRNAGMTHEAQYATLLGHRMRYRFMTNAREAFHLIELRTTPQGHPGYRRICQKMFEEIRRVHPRIAEGMKFVGLDEDPSLTRLAAESAAAYKLSKLDN